MARVKQTKNLNFRRKKNNLRKKTRRNLRKIKGGDVMSKEAFLSLPYEEFLEKVEKMGTELSMYKDLPMYKKMMETQQEIAKKTKAAKEKTEKKEKRETQSLYNTAI